MKVIISPSKTFKKTTITYQSKPRFEDQTLLLQQKLKAFSKEELKAGFNLSDSLLEDVYQYYHVKQDIFPAVFLYDGILYKALNPLADARLNDHLLILSAYHGILRPLDGIACYRLDFHQTLIKDLYAYWRPFIKTYIENLTNELIIDLTSLEFSKLLPSTHKNIYRIDFVRFPKRISSVDAKKMRGYFASHLIKNNITSIKAIKEITLNEFSFNEQLSNDRLLIFSNQ